MWDEREVDGALLAANMRRCELRGIELEESYLSWREHELLLHLWALDLRPELQYAVGPYDLDFYFPEVKLCVEVDGSQHRFRAEQDARRDENLKRYNDIDTMRVAGWEVRRNAPEVAERVQNSVLSRHQKRVA